MKIAKFGGSSLADARQFKKVINIIRRDRGRKIIVVSAPGKRNSSDQKITDLLYEWRRLVSLRLSYEEVRMIVAKRYIEIARDLCVSINMEVEILKIESNINAGASPAYAASRGEYLNGKILAMELGYEFVDPATCIKFDSAGRYVCDDLLLQKTIGNKSVVIPGFYGSDEDGSIKTFSRGGSDITGAIVARAMNASLYENWTDVPGLLMADPRIVVSPLPITTVTYRELRELSYMGANVFHEEAMFPVQEVGIPTNIRDTNNPSHPGTMIVSSTELSCDNRLITGIAGREHFTVITIEKVLMNQEIGFVRKVLAVLEENSVSFEHIPSGIDSLSIIIDEQFLEEKLEVITEQIENAVRPNSIKTYADMAMVAIVGRTMAFTPGIASRVFTAVAKQEINVRMINQGSSELNIIVGVEGKDYKKTIQAIYSAFV